MYPRPTADLVDHGLSPDHSIPRTQRGFNIDIIDIIRQNSSFARYHLLNHHYRRKITSMGKEDKAMLELSKAAKVEIVSSFMRRSSRSTSGIDATSSLGYGWQQNWN